jgi:hypothetical protein
VFEVDIAWALRSALWHICFVPWCVVSLMGRGLGLVWVLMNQRTDITMALTCFFLPRTCGTLQANHPLSQAWAIRQGIGRFRTPRNLLFCVVVWWLFVCTAGSENDTDVVGLEANSRSDTIPYEAHAVLTSLASDGNISNTSIVSCASTQVWSGSCPPTINQSHPHAVNPLGATHENPVCEGWWKDLPDVIESADELSPTALVVEFVGLVTEPSPTSLAGLEAECDVETSFQIPNEFAAAFNAEVASAAAALRGWIDAKRPRLNSPEPEVFTDFAVASSSTSIFQPICSQPAANVDTSPSDWDSTSLGEMISASIDHFVGLVPPGAFAADDADADANSVANEMAQVDTHAGGVIPHADNDYDSPDMDDYTDCEAEWQVNRG